MLSAEFNECPLRISQRALGRHLRLFAELSFGCVFLPPGSKHRSIGVVSKWSTGILFQEALEGKISLFVLPARNKRSNLAGTMDQRVFGRIQLCGKQRHAEQA